MASEIAADVAGLVEALATGVGVAAGVVAVASTNVVDEVESRDLVRKEEQNMSLSRTDTLESSSPAERKIFW